MMQQSFLAAVRPVIPIRDGHGAGVRLDPDLGFELRADPDFSQNQGKVLK